MTRRFLQIEQIGCEKPLLMIVGNYGSGKTEVAVNLALALARAGRRVGIADLDVVNPYFRCREAKALMESAGVRVVVPSGAQSFSELPIVLPEIRSMLRPAAGEISLFDVGGDPVGAKLLSSFAEPLGDAPYELWQVLNSRRPFTDSVDGCLRMRAGIEEASRLRVTGFIANSHLVAETTPDVIREGVRMGQEVSQRSGLPVVFFTAMEELVGHPDLPNEPIPLFVMRRIMLPPWVRPAGPGPEEAQDAQPQPAARAVPLGRRTGA